MNKTRRAIVTAITLSPLAVRAQSAGEGYSTLQNPLPVENPAKVEIAEFFWYGCPHCYTLEPAIEAWVPKLPPDVYFRRIPAVFNERWGHDAVIYYSFEALGLLGKLHRAFFDAIHNDRLKTDNPAALNEWLGRQGVDAKKFEATMKSFGVQSKAKRAAQFSAASKIDGTPALMVQGRYTISAEQGRTRDGMLANAERLIPIVRKDIVPAEGKAKPAKAPKVQKTRPAPKIKSSE
jgi:thiol:disulfide interchange protein DsbA